VLRGGVTQVAGQHWCVKRIDQFDYKSRTTMLPSLLPPILKKVPGFSIRGFLTGLVLSAILGAALYLLLSTL